MRDIAHQDNFSNFSVTVIYNSRAGAADSEKNVNSRLPPTARTNRDAWLKGNDGPSLQVDFFGFLIYITADRIALSVLLVYCTVNPWHWSVQSQKSALKLSFFGRSPRTSIAEVPY
jgi:hypothetical protein